MKAVENELKIFIAGAKELSEERSCIKEVANDLSSSTGTHVFAISYEQLDDKQATYNSYIKDKADIVIFVIDKTLGARTEDEFSIAANSYKNEKHPEVIVFLRKFNKEEITPEMAIERARIEGLIKGKFDDGKYYIDYSKDDDEKDHNIRLKDLKIQAEKRISRYISQHKNSDIGQINSKSAQSSNAIVMPQTDSRLKNKMNTYRIIAWMAAIALAGVLAFQMYSNNFKRSGNASVVIEQDTNSLIVFAGGGSVRSLLNEKYGDSLDVLKYPHSINIGIASGSSWRVLSEEYQYKDYKGINKFITICLSASEMSNTSDFYNEHIGIMKNVIVGEILIGYDTLNVLVSNDLLGRWGMKDSISISTTVLADKIKKIIEAKPETENDVRIFTTNKTSGTLDAYQNSMSNIHPRINFEDLVDNNLEKLIDTILKSKEDTQEIKGNLINEIKRRGKICCIYYDKSAGKDINLGYNANTYKPFIILGSRYYFPENLDTTDYKKLPLVNEKGLFMRKPMYLYFLAEDKNENGKDYYKNENSGDYYLVNPRITEYLKKLDGKIEVDPGMRDKWNALLTDNRIYFQGNECKGKIVKINKECKK